MRIFNPFVCCDTCRTARGATELWLALRNKDYSVKNVSYGSASGKLITLQEDVNFLHEESRHLFVRQWHEDIYDMVRG